MTLFLSAWWLQLRILSKSPFFVSMAILTPLVYGSIAMLMAANQPGEVTTRIVLGAGLMGAWSTTLYGAAEALFMQRFSGTLELLIGAPRGLVAPVLGFSAATVTLGIYSVLAVWIWSVLVFRVRLEVPSPADLTLSLVVSFIGLVAAGLLLAGLYVITRQAIEITNVLEYPIWIVCGVLTSTSLLWPPLAWVGKLLPLGWAVEAIDITSAGGSPYFQLAMSLALSVLYFVVGLIFLGRLDLLARQKGTLRLR